MLFSPLTKYENLELSTIRWIDSHICEVHNINKKVEFFIVWMSQEYKQFEVLKRNNQ